MTSRVACRLLGLAVFLAGGCESTMVIPPLPDSGPDAGTDAGAMAVCDNSVRDGDETGIDCGGSCPACADGESCLVAADCESLVCERSHCLVPSCMDRVRNGEETGTDCGGSCDLCPGGEPCTDNAQCLSGRCRGGVCAMSDCDDGRMNGDETDVDCGGPMCRACGGGAMCDANADCESLICRGGACSDAACNDSIQNQDETSVDCGGGTCAPCRDGLGCIIDSDCVGLRCFDGGCVSCTDMIRDAEETDVDCGGGLCGPCADGLMCLSGSDCANRTCLASTCVSCMDGVVNQDETDVDCGGALCPGCAPGLLCAMPSDCASMICDGPSGRCNAVGCGDMILNGEETDLDCGGSACLGCPVGGVCILGRDCLSGSCGGGTCQAPTCTDGVRNGTETDVDCGGPGTCPRCPDFDTCSMPSDCMTGMCTMGYCGSTGCIPFPGTSTDPFGYSGCSLMLTPTTLPCPDISTTGTGVTLTDDDDITVPIGFNVDFYGTSRSSVAIGANGGLVFGTGGLTFVASCLPPTSTDPMIGVFWDDLYPPGGGTVQHQTLGTAPNRQFVVRWNIENLSGATGDFGDFTVVLHENGDIDSCYVDTIFGDPWVDSGAEATVGISGSATNYLEYSCASPTVTNGLWVHYDHP